MSSEKPLPSLPGVTVIPTPPKQAASSEPDETEETLDILKTCHAFIERIDVGDGKKLFHEVERDVEKAGGLLATLFSGTDEEKQSAKDSLLASLCGEE